MRLKSLELNGFKSFAKKTSLEFQSSITSIVGPNGSGKSNVVEAIRFVLGEQSMKSMRGKGGSDLIFKGSKNLPKSSRASVSIYFDNKDKIFHLDNEGGEKMNLNFDTISISREVFADGLNKYSLNGSEVRLKDIMALLASVNIGSSGHQIISQGEADRVLNASMRERREMIEDALGLKIYQYKIRESERKLEKSSENMKEVSMLRKEIVPHLKFLKGQVEKFEKAKEMKVELLGLYLEYLKKESVYLEKEKSTLLADKNRISGELKDLASKISENRDEGNEPENQKVTEIKNLELKISEIRNLRGEMERKLGRIEGMLESKENKVLPSGKCPLCGKEIGQIEAEALEKKHNQEAELAELKATQEGILAETQKMKEEEVEIFKSVEGLKVEIDNEMKAVREQEREKFEYKVRHQELSSALSLIAVKEENLARETESFENEIKEGGALIGSEILQYKNTPVEGPAEKHIQEEQRRKIERIKIKLEDAGAGGSEEVMKEWSDVQERDNFLEKEMADLAVSIDSLRRLMLDLKEKIDTEFKEGIKKINTEFQEFFSLMFGGGSAFLSMVAEQKRKKGSEEEEEVETDEGIVFEHGVEISVSLPHKKVKELNALSGGERSLTSIALLFAMSQVNPPPFLVLDETDAALDEANSRKYGDMLEKLSKHSQLIVVTHNRETMSRAGVLYGVTAGAEGASKLLSVKFEEATAIAK